jgi:hypothetical protein
MIVTEKEADEMWCPYSRRYHPNGSYNRDGYGVISYTMCMGSKCMAWRWVQDPLVEFVANGKPTNTKSEYGYCGLAERK